MEDKLDELHYIYKMIGDYGFCTVQRLLDEYNKQKETINKAVDKLYCWGETLNIDFQREMLDILKGVEDSED